MRRRKSNPAAECAAFNRDYPVGQRVRYWPAVRPEDDSGGFESSTRSDAQVLSGHTAVVWVDGYAGCIALSHVKPLGGVL